MNDLLSHEQNQQKIHLEKIEDTFFDVNRIPGNGMLVFPLSMSRLFLGQDPKTLYESLCFLQNKMEEMTIDIAFIYTNGLYFNNSGDSSSLRKKTNAQMLTHKVELSKLIKKDNRFSPSAIHFIPWDYLLLQAENYLSLHAILLKQLACDSFFKTLVTLETKSGFNESLEKQSFLIEETLITYLIRNKLVKLPTTLSDLHGWGLIVYQVRCLSTDVYLYQTKLLPQMKPNFSESWFNKIACAGMYNMQRKILVDYTKINFDSLTVPNEKKRISTII